MEEERVVMASAFKARCLSLIDRVSIDRVPVVITKRGRRVARLVAIDDVEPVTETRGSVRLIAEDDEDYYSTGEAWDPER